jgi:hypothetical protein
MPCFEAFSAFTSSSSSIVSGVTAEWAVLDLWGALVEDNSNIVPSPFVVSDVFTMLGVRSCEVSISERWSPTRSVDVPL